MVQFSAALCQIFDSIFSEYRCDLKQLHLTIKSLWDQKALEKKTASLTGVCFTIIVDVPMSRVKFNVNTEYAYLQNFKVLQSMSRRHRHAITTPSNDHPQTSSPDMVLRSLFPCSPSPSAVCRITLNSSSG